jgi:hypothetical protein
MLIIKKYYIKKDLILLQDLIEQTFSITINLIKKSFRTKIKILKYNLQTIFNKTKKIIKVHRFL